MISLPGKGVMGPILIVEDDEAVAYVVRDALVAEGYRVEVALSALAALDSALPALIILDLNLGWARGELVAQMLSERTGRVIPIVGLSADPGAHDRFRDLRGVVAVMRKPFDLDDLVTVVTACLQSTRLQDRTTDGCASASPGDPNRDS